MNPTDVPWPPFESAESSAGVEPSMGRSLSSRLSRSQNVTSGQASTRISRSSSASVKSQIINVFANVKDIIGPGKTSDTDAAFQTGDEYNHLTDLAPIHVDKRSLKSTSSINEASAGSPVSPIPIFDPHMETALHNTEAFLRQDNVDRERLAKTAQNNRTQSRRLYRPSLPLGDTSLESTHHALTGHPGDLSPEPANHVPKVYYENFRHLDVRSHVSKGHRKQLSVDKVLPPPPYHVFDLKQKRFIIYLVYFASMLSPKSSSIYYPALGAIAAEFHVNYSLVLLSIAIHMAAQGFAPFAWMPFSESVGRRAALSAAIVISIGANAGLLFSQSFAFFLIFRGLQGFGTTSVPSIGAAIIGDISEGNEKRRFTSILGSILMFSHFVSPVIGGALIQQVNFRSIFRILLIYSAFALFLIFSTLPETLRSVAGDGTIRVHWLHRPLIQLFKPSAKVPLRSEPSFSISKSALKRFFESLSSVFQPEILAGIIFGGLTFAIWATITSTTALLFSPSISKGCKSHFDLSPLFVGLTFLPTGAGSIVGFSMTRFFLSRNKHGAFPNRNSNTGPTYQSETPSQNTASISTSFPITPKRLLSGVTTTVVFIAATATFGFSLQLKLLFLALILQFIIASTATSILLLNGVMISNLQPDTSGSLTAVINLVRFALGATAVGTVWLLADWVGVPLAFVVFAGILGVYTGILLVWCCWEILRTWGGRILGWPRGPAGRIVELE